jgi:hypothetical protein
LGVRKSLVQQPSHDFFRKKELAPTESVDQKGVLQRRECLVQILSQRLDLVPVNDGGLFRRATIGAPKIAHFAKHDKIEK